MQQSKRVPDGYIKLSDWAKAKGLSNDTVVYMSRTGKLKTEKIFNKLYVVPEQPVVDVLQGWMNIKDFAEAQSIPAATVYRMISKGRLKFRRVGLRFQVWSETRMERKERPLSCGKKLIYWEAQTGGVSCQPA